MRYKSMGHYVTCWVCIRNGRNKKSVEQKKKERKMEKWKKRKIRKKEK
jgi:hypothetical protein